MKCNRKDCPNYDSEENDNCKEFTFDCIHFKKNETFDLEWIPVTDEEKPGHFESVLLKIKHDHGIDFEKGDYNKESEIWSHHKTRHYSKPKVTDWARITLPGESE